MMVRLKERNIMESLRSGSSVISGRSSGGMGSLMPFENIPVGVMIAIVAISFIVALVVFVLLVERKKAPRSKFLSWLREYLNFRSILISGLIKFTYLFLAIILTAFGIVIMCSGRDEMVLPMLGVGFAVVVFGNIILRLLLELTMMIIGMWENTSDMRAVLVRNDEKPVEKAPKKPVEKPVEEPAVASVEGSVNPPVNEPATTVESEPTVPSESVTPSEPASQSGPVTPSEPMTQ